MISTPEPQKIREIFSSIAAGYDRANDVMTFGLARSWRKQLVRWSQVRPGQSVLDVATGTGDLALDFAQHLGQAGSVIGVDFCPEMLARAPSKAAAANLRAEFQVADALQLPFPNATFDVVSIAYGLRNVADPIRAIQEMHRVCKPGGRVMILETGETKLPLVGTGIRFYFSWIVPRLGGLITGRRGAYEYLSESSGRFPSQESLTRLMRQAAPFTSVSFRSLMGGASYLYRGFKADLPKANIES